MPSKDVEKRRQHVRTHYEKNKAKYRRYAAERFERLKKMVFDIKQGSPCMDCGGFFHHVAMDFDHRPGEAKIADINTMIRDRRGQQVILDEIAKCDLVCANCHRVRTWLRQCEARPRTSPDRPPRHNEPSLQET